MGLYQKGTTVTNALAATTLTSTSPDLPPDLYGYAAMHLGMHRDAARLVRTLDGRPADPVALARWWASFRAVIIRHHVREDDLIWPALAGADPTFVADVAAMHDDHHELDGVMDRLDLALRRLPTAPRSIEEARGAARDFRDILVDHLGREEAVAFHRIAAHPGLWAGVERRIERDTRLREAAFELPWVLDALDTGRATHLMHRVPRPFRPVVRWLWQPRYERAVTAAHGVQVTA
jgi:hypothetical protein